MSADTFDVVRWYDPEVARYTDGATAGRYCVERDMAILNLPPEAQPIIFRCRLLDRAQRRVVKAQTTDDRRYEVAFRFGVLSIRNLPSPSGVLRELSFSRRKDDEALDDKAIDDTGLSDDDLSEIGSVIVARSFLPLGTPLSCPQLPSSLLAWAAVRSRFVEQSRGDTSTATDD